MKSLVFGPTEIIYLLGLITFSVGVAIRFGFGFGLMASGSILLVTAFRNSSEREPKSEKGS